MIYNFTVYIYNCILDVTLVWHCLVSVLCLSCVCLVPVSCLSRVCCSSQVYYIHDYTQTCHCKVTPQQGDCHDAVACPSQCRHIVAHTITAGHFHFFEIRLFFEYHAGKFFSCFFQPHTMADHSIRGGWVKKVNKRTNDILDATSIVDIAAPVLNSVWYARHVRLCNGKQCTTAPPARV